MNRNKNCKIAIIGAPLPKDTKKFFFLNGTKFSVNLLCRNQFIHIYLQTYIHTRTK